MSRRNDEKELVSFDNTRGFSQDPWDESKTVKYFSDDMLGVHVRPEFCGKNIVDSLEINRDHPL